MKRIGLPLLAGAFMALACLAPTAARAQTVTFLPYIQPGDEGPLGPTDQMVIAWQTDETSPNDGAYVVTYHTGSEAPAAAQAHGRVVDNYLSADPQLSATLDASHKQIKHYTPSYGPHTDYYALLPGLSYDTAYTYTVNGPGMPAGGFTATFHTRKTGSTFSFQVEGDEGSVARGGDYQGRIIHTMYDIANIRIAGAPTIPKPDFNLNAGDNCYFTGSDSEYYDHWMGVWNYDQDDLYGAPYIRSIPFYVTVGNHDVFDEGLQADIENGDELACFNNFYDPLNGPEGVDIEYTWHGDQSKAAGFILGNDTGKDAGPPPPASVIEALRASTTVDTGQGVKRQIDHESNYSFDYGNAHFVVLDANPHLFDFYPYHIPPWAAPPTMDFPPYPTVLKNWLINDLDSSNAAWKFVVYHQPAFTSGDSAFSDDNMRRIAKLLEDHGVNVVFNGHEHNYERAWPLRALPALDNAPIEPGPPSVAIDTHFDGASHTVPDGVIYLIEGAGGGMEFDSDGGPHAGAGWIGQDDSATGARAPSFPPPNYPTTASFPRGPASWLDTNLTNTAMAPIMPAAGQGPKITVKFKAQVFSFGDVVVNGNTLSLYQISEPLSDRPATPAADNPIPWGTDYRGKPLNDPLPKTEIDFDHHGKALSGEYGQGTPALLDKFTITRPNVAGKLVASLTRPSASAGEVSYTVKVANNTGIGLNGVQVVFHVPPALTLDASVNENTTVHGQDAVVTIGRLDPGSHAAATLSVPAPAGVSRKTLKAVTALVRSSTAQPVPAAPR